ncbi:MAG: hypothetical protein O2779_03685 [Nanoarchaeota archaeon]|nr:hypothetical protein [Nanoarchaeota archaeon]
MILELMEQGNAVLNAGIASYAIGWKIWLGIMGITNLLAFAFIKKREAQFTILAFSLNIPLMTFLAATFGFERILGLGHFFWIPLVIYLTTRYKEIPIKTYYGKWVRLLMIIISISLVIDIADVVRYVLGV